MEGIGKPHYQAKITASLAVTATGAVGVTIAKKQMRSIAEVTDGGPETFCGELWTL
jgi:hypothetical protein